MSIDFEKASAAELRQFRSTLDPAEVEPHVLRQLDDLIIDKAIAEGMARTSEHTTFVSKAKEMDKRAYEAWPELEDKDSELYKKANEIMEANPNRDKDPSALFSAATMAGMELGMTPKGFTPAKDRRPIDTLGDSGDEGRDEPESGSDFLQRTTKIAKAFEESGLLNMGDEKVRKRIEGFAEAEEK